MIEGVLFTPEAEQDVTEAYSWYEAREPELGEEFPALRGGVRAHYSTASTIVSGRGRRVPAGTCPAVPIRDFLSADRRLRQHLLCL